MYWHALIRDGLASYGTGKWKNTGGCACVVAIQTDAGKDWHANERRHAVLVNRL